MQPCLPTRDMAPSMTESDMTFIFVRAASLKPLRICASLIGKITCFLMIMSQQIPSVLVE